MTAATLVAAAAIRGLTITTAESCTGGLLAAALTAIPGASEVFGTGFVTYSNAAKTALLGVPMTVIRAVGAVSEGAARAMAEGARIRADADLSLAITGVAGPGGGTAEKPVGTVWFGLATARGTEAHHKLFPGDRDAIRQASVTFALTLLLDAANHE